MKDIVSTVVFLIFLMLRDSLRRLKVSDSGDIANKRTDREEMGQIQDETALSPKSPKRKHGKHC